MSAIYILWLRELKHYARSKPRMIGSLSQPLLYVLVLGFGLGPVFEQSGRGSYLQFIAPGMIAMVVLYSSISSGMGIVWDRQFGVLKQTLVAPVPRIQIVAGRTCGAATIALIDGVLVALVCTMVGFRPVSYSALPAAFGFMALIAIVFAGLGTSIGSSVKDMQSYYILSNVLVAPLFFLSGALFPLENLPPVLAVLAALDPLTYGVDGLRATLIGQSHSGPAMSAAVLGMLAIVFGFLAGWTFSKTRI